MFPGKQSGREYAFPSQSILMATFTGKGPLGHPGNIGTMVPISSDCLAAQRTSSGPVGVRSPWGQHAWERTEDRAKTHVGVANSLLPVGI